MTLWKISCQEDDFPGLWLNWYTNQCVGLGWHRDWGYRLDGRAKDRGWARARAALQRIVPGDFIIVSLHRRRLGRLGEVIRLATGDNDWNPLVPPSKSLPQGELGRRIDVRWDLAAAPFDRDQVVVLPTNVGFSQGEIRPTLAVVNSLSLSKVRSILSDKQNWVHLLPSFRDEKALSDYIAAYPHHLEQGLVPHPSKKIRERIFKDRSRLDVLLMDSSQRPVIVECKQHAPTLADLSQLRRYMMLLEDETELSARGILVHGGSRKIDSKVSSAATKAPAIELVHYGLHVTFSASS